MLTGTIRVHDIEFTFPAPARIGHDQINKMRRQEPKDCAASLTDQSTYIIHANGEIIAKLSVVFHMTINANGEFTAYVEPDSWSVECF